VVTVAEVLDELRETEKAIEEAYKKLDDLEKQLDAAFKRFLERAEQSQ
jgi:hypothetical protein